MMMESGWVVGGAEEGRTPGLRIANAALCQLSYCPTCKRILRTQSRSVKLQFWVGEQKLRFSIAYISYQSFRKRTCAPPPAGAQVPSLNGLRRNYLDQFKNEKIPCRLFSA